MVNRGVEPLVSRDGRHVDRMLERVSWSVIIPGRASWHLYILHQPEPQDIHVLAMLTRNAWPTDNSLISFATEKVRLGNVCPDKRSGKIGEITSFKWIIELVTSQ